jgi:hypothetical protein
MDSKARIRLIRERHRKVILEPRRRIQYDPLDSWDDEPLFDDEELATSFSQVDDSMDDE